jgi:hypothetical protein
MQIRECVLPDQREHNHNAPQFIKDTAVSQDHSVWEEYLLLSVTGLSINSIRSLNHVIDAAMAKLENGLLDITPLIAEQEIMFFGGKNA